MADNNLNYKPGSVDDLFNMIKAQKFDEAKQAIKSESLRIALETVKSSKPARPKGHHPDEMCCDGCERVDEYEKNLLKAFEDGYSDE